MQGGDGTALNRLESLRALWYQIPTMIFLSHGILFPPVLGYNDFRQKKEKEPSLSVELYEYHIQQLTGNRGVYRKCLIPLGMRSEY